MGVCVPFLQADDITSLLTDIVGIENWSTEYKELHGTIYCRLGIKINGNWVYKEAAGGIKKGAIEPDKSLESSALKRAGKRWGIGVFMDNIPNQHVKLSGPKSDTNKPYPVNEQGQKIQDLTDYLMQRTEVANCIAKCYDKKPGRAPAQVDNSKYDAIVDIDSSANIDELRNKYKPYSALMKENPVINSIFNAKAQAFQLNEAVNKLNNVSTNEDVTKLIEEYKLLKENKPWEMIVEYKLQLLRMSKAAEPASV
jgi:hypothetical protein